MRYDIMLHACPPYISSGRARSSQPTQKSSVWSKGPGVASQAHQLDEVLGHAKVVLVDGMDHSVNECLLVVVAQLRHIAEVNIGDAPISQCEDVSCSTRTSAQTKSRMDLRAAEMGGGGGGGGQTNHQQHDGLGKSIIHNLPMKHP